jgi:hypothetical protein
LRIKKSKNTYSTKRRWQRLKRSHPYLKSLIKSSMIQGSIDFLCTVKKDTKLKLKILSLSKKHIKEERKWKRRRNK